MPSDFGIGSARVNGGHTPPLTPAPWRPQAAPNGTRSESPLMPAGANRPLAGIVVLDFGQIYQGPYATLRDAPLFGLARRLGSGGRPSAGLPVGRAAGTSSHLTLPPGTRRPQQTDSAVAAHRASRRSSPNEGVHAVGGSEASRN